YRVAGFVERSRRLRAVLDRPAFTTDIIVGFPGETEADFEATCRVVQEVGFSKIHVFSYSPRRGTPAAELSHRVAQGVIAARRQRLQELECDLANGYFRSLLGSRLDVLVEGSDPDRPGYVRGTSRRYAPVAFEGRIEALRRQIVPVRAVAV